MFLGYNQHFPTTEISSPNKKEVNHHEADVTPSTPLNKLSRPKKGEFLTIVGVYNVNLLNKQT